jgi:hypothetical protein
MGAIFCGKRRIYAGFSALIYFRAEIPPAFTEAGKFPHLPFPPGEDTETGRRGLKTGTRPPYSGKDACFPV